MGAAYFLRRGLVDAAVALAGAGRDKGADTDTGRGAGGGRVSRRVEGGHDDRAQIKSCLERDSDSDGDGDDDEMREVGRQAGAGAGAEAVNETEAVAAAAAANTEATLSALSAWPEWVLREALARRSLSPRAEAQVVSLLSQRSLMR